MSSSKENSPTRKVNQYKFNPSNPRVYKLLTKHTAAKAKCSIKEKDNLGKIVATLVKGKYVSTYKHAVAGTFNIDLSPFITMIQNEINESIMANIVEEDSVAKVTNTIIDVAGKPPIIQLKTNIVFESDTVEPINAAAHKLKVNNDATTKMSVKFRTGVPHRNPVKTSEIITI